MDRLMCDYCGCQALPAIALLTREHDAALDRIRRAEQALDDGDDAGAAGASAELRELLRPHTAVEEEALLPAMAADFPGQIAELLAEHEQIGAALDDAAGECRPGWQWRLRAALSLLRTHIRKEQDGVFPAALAILTPAEWDRLETSRLRARGLAEEVLRD